MLPTTLGDRNDFPDFSDEENKTEKDCITDHMSNNQNKDSNPDMFDSKAHSFIHSFNRAYYVSGTALTMLNTFAHFIFISKL